MELVTSNCNIFYWKQVVSAHPSSVSSSVFNLLFGNCSNCCSVRETTARRNPRWALTPQFLNLRNEKYSSRRSLCLNSSRDGGIMRTNPQGNGFFVGDKDGVIIVDHGSRRKESNLMLSKLRLVLFFCLSNTILYLILMFLSP